MSGTPVWGPMHRSVACTVIDFFLAILINGYSLEANECLLVLRGKGGRFHFGRRHCKADNKGCKNASSVESGELILSWTKCLVSPVPGKSREGKRGVLGWWLCDSSTASLSSFCLSFVSTCSVREGKKLSTPSTVRGVNASERSVQPQSELLCPIPHVLDYTINPVPPQIITYRPAALGGVRGAPGVLEECSRGSPRKWDVI